MTRYEFYGKTAIITVISAVWVFFSEDKAAMNHKVFWCMSTVGAYCIWHNWSVIPESWKFWRKP